MLRLAVLGAGNHSQGNHLPALARFAAERPGEIELSALCDLRRDHAAQVATHYGFSRIYDDLDEMLRAEQPDGCIAVTPIPVTAPVAERVINAGVPLLMEKPPGATVGEARRIARLAQQSPVPVMVSMNRRFDPALRAGLAWWGDRPLGYLRATIARVDRREPDFVEGTAIHPLDAMRHIAGSVRHARSAARHVDGVWWFAVHLSFESGAEGLLEILPSAGSMVESCELFGARARCALSVGGTGSGRVRAWEGGQQVLESEPSLGLPEFVRNGTYAETLEFISALQQGRMPSPSPAEVLQSVELCHQIARSAQT